MPRASIQAARLQQWFSRLASLATASIAIIVLCGWILGNKNLINILLGTVPMHPNTAVMFLLAAISLWFCAGKAKARLVGRICSAAVVVFALVRLGAYLLGGGSTIDGLLFPKTFHLISAAFAPVHIQMAPNTCISFLLSGTCLLLIHSRWRQFPFFIGLMLTFASALLSMLTICGRLINVAGLGAQIASIPMSVATATGFLLLAMSMFVELVRASASEIDHEDPAVQAIAMRRSLQHKVAIGFGAAIFMLSGVEMVSYKAINQFLNDSRWTGHTYQVIATVNALYANLKDAEAAERGYVITGDAGYLPPQLAASQAVIPTLQELKSLTVDNAAQQKRIGDVETIIKQKLDYFQNLVQVRRMEGFDAARESFATGRGVQLMDRTRFILDQMRAEENRLLAIRVGGTETNALRSILLISCAAGLALILIIAAGWIINRDINWRAKAEAAVRASEMMFRGLLESAPDAMVIVDGTGKIQLVNAQAERVFGYTADEMLAQQIEILVPQRYRKDHINHPNSYFADLEMRDMAAGLELSGLRKDGSEFPVEVSLSPMHTPQGLRVSSAIRDISQRKRAEEETRNFFTFSHDLLCIAGTDGYFKRLNLAWEKVLGHSEEELKSVPYADLVHMDDREATLAEASKIADGRPAVQFENRYRCKDGSYRWLMWTATLSSDRQRIYAAARDVTERKSHEEATRQLNDTLRARQIELEAANKELESFSYSVSHDLRAPLRAIDGFSQALLEDYGEQFGDDGKDSLQRVRAATQRMGHLIYDMLNLSRVTRSELRREKVDLSAIARSIAAELQKAQPDRKAEFIIAEGLVCDGDAPLLLAALENLLGNAWKFTSKRDGSRIEFGIAQDAAATYFVRDNGAGFDMNFSQKLFGAFQRLHATTDFPGTGVGLAIVQRIILRHGGRIWAEAAVDKGATFFFTLNAERAAMALAA